MTDRRKTSFFIAAFRLRFYGRTLLLALLVTVLIVPKTNVVYAAVRSWRNARRQTTVEASVKARDRSLSTSIASVFDALSNPYFINETEHVIKSSPTTVYGMFVPPTIQSPVAGRRPRKKLSSSLMSPYQPQQHNMQSHDPFVASSSQLQPSYDLTATQPAAASSSSSSVADTSSGIPVYDDLQYYYEPPAVTAASSAAAAAAANHGQITNGPLITLEEHALTTTTTTTTTQQPRKKLSVAPFIPERRRGAGSGGGGQTMSPTHPTRRLLKPNPDTRSVHRAQLQPPVDAGNGYSQPQNHVRDIVEVFSNNQNFDAKHDITSPNQHSGPVSTTDLDFPAYDETPAAGGAAAREAAKSSSSTTAVTQPPRSSSFFSSSTPSATTVKTFTTKRSHYKQQTLFQPPTKSTTPSSIFFNHMVETTDYTPLHIITHNRQPKKSTSDSNNHQHRRHVAPSPPQQTNVLITLHDIVPSPQTPAATTAMMHNNNPQFFAPPPPGLHASQQPRIHYNNTHPQSRLFDEDLPGTAEQQPTLTGKNSPTSGGAFFPDEPYQQHTTFVIDAWAVPPPETFDCGAHGGVGYFADVLRDCYVFYHCKPDNTYERLTCPAGLRFDEQARACVEKDTVQCGHGKQQQQKQFDCNGKTGFYADPFAPGKSSYYFCWGNNPPQHYNCPPGLLFNEKCGACDLPQNCGGKPINNNNNVNQLNVLNSQKSSAEVFNLNSHQNNFIAAKNQQLNINDIHDGPNDVVAQPPPVYGSTLHDSNNNDKQVNSRNNNLLLAANQQQPPLLPPLSLSPSQPVQPLPIYSTFDCTGRYGLFADEHVSGCQSYWMCLPDGARHRLTCPPHLRFNEQLGTCDWPKNVACRNSGDILLNGGPSSGGGGGRTNNIFQDNSINTLAARSACRDRVGFYADHGNHCKSYVYCSEDGKAFEYFCPPAQAYNETIGACDDAQRVQCYYQLAHDRAQQLHTKTASTHRMVLGPTAVDCSGKNGLYADPFHSCKVYYFCNYGKQVKLQCPPGQIFNDELQMCDLEQNVVCMPPFDGTANMVPSPLSAPHNDVFTPPPPGLVLGAQGPGLFEPNSDTTHLPVNDPAFFNQFKPQYQAMVPNESPQRPQIPNFAPPQLPQPPPSLPNGIINRPIFPFQPPVQQQQQQLPPPQISPQVLQQQQQQQQQLLVPPQQQLPQMPLQPQQPSLETGFDCRGLIGYYPDIMLSCRVYYYCRGDGSRFQFRCPANLRYNASLGICDWPEKVYCPEQIPQQPYLPTFYEPPVFDCRGQVGFLGDRDRDYRIFYFCEVNGRKHRFSCPSNLKFNEARGVCDWPDSILRGPYQGRVEFDCSNRPQGYYGSPVNGIDNVVYYCPGNPTASAPPPGPQPGNTPPSLFTNDISAELYAQKQQQQQQQTLLAGRAEVPPQLNADAVEKQIPKKIVCPASLQYNPSIGACDWPENTASNAFDSTTQQHSQHNFSPDGNMLLHEQPAALQLANKQLQNIEKGTDEAELAHRMLVKMMSARDVKVNLNSMDSNDSNKFEYTRQPVFGAGGMRATPRKGMTLDVSATAASVNDGKTTSRPMQRRFGNLLDKRKDVYINDTTDAESVAIDSLASTPASFFATSKAAHSVCKLLGHGFWADEKRNCSDYIYCRDDDKEFRFSCPPRLKFNEILGACDLTANVKCKQRDYSKLFPSSLSATTATSFFVSTDKEAEEAASRLLRSSSRKVKTSDNHSGSNLPGARHLYRSGRRPAGQLKRQLPTSVPSTTTAITNNSFDPTSSTTISSSSSLKPLLDCYGRVGLFADRQTDCKQFYKCHQQGSFVMFKCSRDSWRFNERLQACEAKTNFECIP